MQQDERDSVVTIGEGIGFDNDVWLVLHLMIAGRLQWRAEWPASGSRPEASRAFDGLHVYYVHKLPVNGVYMGEDYAIVQETAKLREVEGGIDEPVAAPQQRTLAIPGPLPH